MSAPMDGCVRVSRVGGREGDSYGSPAVQESEIRRWAGLHGVTLARVVREEDVSGGKAVHDRELGRLIERAERGQTGGVVVYSTSRFARSVVEGAIAIKRLRDVGARVVGVSDGVDSDRDQLGLNIHLAIAEDELRRRREAWAAATERAVARGVHVACKAPLGYLRRDQLADGGQRDGRLAPDPGRPGVIQRGFEARAAGASLLAVARLWGCSKSYARAMLRNRVYLGEARGPNGARLPGAHEPLVSEELFAAVQQTFAGLGRRTAWARRAQPAGVPSGLITCAACGYRLRDVNAGTPRASYACVGRYSTGDCPAPASASISAVDDYVIGLLDAEPRLTERIVEAYRGRRDAWEAAGEAVARAETRLERVIDATMEMQDRALARRRVAEAEEELGRARAALYALDAPADEAVEADNAWRSVIADVTLAKADPRRRRHQPIAERVRIRWAA